MRLFSFFRNKAIIQRLKPLPFVKISIQNCKVKTDKPCVGFHPDIREGLSPESNSGACKPRAIAQNAGLPADKAKPVL